MRRLLYLGIAVTIMLMLPAFAGAQSLEQGFLYQTGVDGNMTITAYVGADSDVVVPNQIAGRMVTAIGDEAFSDNSQLVSVVIPEGVFSIGRPYFQSIIFFYISIGIGRGNPLKSSNVLRIEFSILL